LTPTGKAVLGNFGGTGFGDVALVPGMNLKHAEGIRDIEEWYVSLSLRPGYIYEVFERQCDIGVANLARIHEVVGDKISAIFVTGHGLWRPARPVDLAQHLQEIVPTLPSSGELLGPCQHSLEDLHPFLRLHLAPARRHRRRRVRCLEPCADFSVRHEPSHFEAEVRGPRHLLGGGIDTQSVLPFGTPADVRAIVKERMRLFGQGGGFVFNTVHNVQAGGPDREPAGTVRSSQ
jgi:hypothetical protein